MNTCTDNLYKTRAYATSGIVWYLVTIPHSRLWWGRITLTKQSHHQVSHHYISHYHVCHNIMLSTLSCVSHHSYRLGSADWPIAEDLTATLVSSSKCSICWRCSCKALEIFGLISDNRNSDFSVSHSFYKAECIYWLLIISYWWLVIDI